MELVDLIIILVILAVDVCMLVIMIKDYELRYKARYGDNPRKRRKK
jgi:hypothetical protein